MVLEDRTVCAFVGGESWLSKDTRVVWSAANIALLVVAGASYMCVFTFQIFIKLTIYNLSTFLHTDAVWKRLTFRRCQGSRRKNGDPAVIDLLFPFWYERHYIISLGPPSPLILEKFQDFFSLQLQCEPVNSSCLVFNNAHWEFVPESGPLCYPQVPGSRSLPAGSWDCPLIVLRFHPSPSGLHGVPLRSRFTFLFLPLNPNLGFFLWGENETFILSCCLLYSLRWNSFFL